MSLAKLLLRMFARFDMWSIQMHLDGQNKAISATRDIDLYFEMVKSRRITRDELAAARKRYEATFKPGNWRSA